MKVTLITGASGGIGEAFAKRLAAEKDDLVLVARSEEKLKKLCDNLAAQHNINAQYIVADLSVPGADKTLFDETEKRGMQVDFLVNNAGIGSAGDFALIELESELDMVTLNIATLVGLTHRYVNKMRARKSGTIINVSSVAGYQPIPYMATYAASKAFVRSFTEAIIEECKPYNVQVLLLCPGATETNFFDAAKVDDGLKNSMAAGSFETPEAVVDNAMKGLKSGKRVVISGFKNAITANMGSLIPNSLITRVMAKVMKPKSAE